MGYTHYWYRPKELDAAKFSLAVDECRKACEAIPVPLAGWDGKGEPEFSEDQVSFNGCEDAERNLSFAKVDAGIAWPASKAEGYGVAGDETREGGWFAGALLGARSCDAGGDGSHETFRVSSTEDKQPFDDDDPMIFACCKTAFKPYDLSVQACLVVFKHFFANQFLVKSDGDDEAWDEARKVCQEVLGFGGDFALDE